jgi:membrane-associated protease RseP (regulator of RpoE activity)
MEARMRGVPFAIGLVFLGLVAGCRGGVVQESGAATRAPATHGSGASLGVKTHAPSAALAKEMALPFSVRVQGQEIRGVLPGSAAERAGLRVGDMILQIGENTLFSADDLEDVLRVSRPGDEVDLRFKRAGTTAEERAALVLGKPPLDGEAAPAKGFEWDFAGLAQLPRALESAAAGNKRVLVGLSGAET